MSSKSRPYCFVCRHYIRGSQAVHNQTKEHRRRANPHPRKSKAVRRREEGRRVRRAQSDDYIPVVHYRRSPPADGIRRTVKVRHHWRHLPTGRWIPYGFLPESAADRARKYVGGLSRLAGLE